MASVWSNPQKSEEKKQIIGLDITYLLIIITMKSST